MNRSPVPKDSRTLPLSASKLMTTVAPSANAIESTLVIVVDDDASVANSTCRLIRSLGMRGEAFFSGADLLNLGRATEASCLILDVLMPNLDGLQLQRRLTKGNQAEYSRDLLQRPRGQGRGRAGATLRCGGFFAQARA